MIPPMRPLASPGSGRALAGAALAAPLGLAAAWSVPALAPVVPALADALGIPTRTAAHGAVALTFDDGPHPQGTPAVLDVLAAAGASATFFLVGTQVLRSPALAAELVAAGHAVAVHGYRHRNLLRMPLRALEADLDRAAAVIADATGVAPALHRPPYGIYSWPALKAVRARGWTPVLWSRWGRDWRRSATPDGIAVTVAGGVRGGDVLLLHDADDYSVPGSWRATAAALPRVLEAVAASGLTLVPLSAEADLAQPAGR
jgi:peptidoglycan/xylan/chitin deacetylase (PgdA/CDA1 family)